MIALATHIITTAPCIGTKIIRTPGGTCPGSRIAGPCVIARAKIVTIRNNRNLSMQKNRYTPHIHASAGYGYIRHSRYLPDDDDYVTSPPPGDEMDEQSARRAKGRRQSL